MIKLTRLNNQTVVVNPDHVYAADATPDTTLRLISGEMILVRESIDELVARVIEFRRLVITGVLGVTDADSAAAAASTLRQRVDTSFPPRSPHNPQGGR